MNSYDHLKSTIDLKGEPSVLVLLYHICIRGKVGNSRKSGQGYVCLIPIEKGVMRGQQYQTKPLGT